MSERSESRHRGYRQTMDLACLADPTRFSAPDSANGDTVGGQLAFQHHPLMPIDRVLDAVLQVGRFAREQTLYFIAATRNIAISWAGQELHHLPDIIFVAAHSFPR